MWIYDLLHKSEPCRRGYGLGSPVSSQRHWWCSDQTILSHVVELIFVLASILDTARVLLDNLHPYSSRVQIYIAMALIVNPTASPRILRFLRHL